MDEEGEVYLTQNHIHVDNNHTKEFWLKLSQERNVKNPLRDLNNDHCDEFVRTFQHEKYLVGFGLISVTFEKDHMSCSRHTNQIFRNYVRQSTGGLNAGNGKGTI